MRTALRSLLRSWPTWGLRIVLLAIVLALPAPAWSAWYGEDWSYRKQITIQSSKVSETLSNFPVLIKLDSDADLAARARGDGFDILFTDDDGTTKLDHEIEEYVTGTGELVAWVKVPTLPHTVDKDIYLYYGYPSSPDQQNASGVWTDGFDAVWHWDDDFLDSAGSNDGTNQGSTDATAMFADGQSFDGIDDYVDLTVMNPKTYDDWTISVWYKSADPSVSDDEYIYMHLGNPDEIVFGPTDDGSEGLRLALNNDGSWVPYYSTTDVVDQQWHHLVGARGGGRIKIWIDGTKELDDPDPQPGSPFVCDTEGPYAGDRPGVTEQVHGLLDELRISGVARTEGWVETEFNNQDSPGSFFTLGAEATASYSISGRVFEDADFAGTASAYDGGTNDAGQSNVDVELYDGSDVYVSSVTTGAGGTFSFIGLSDGTYKIRARSATIGDADTPPAGGLNGTVPGTWPYPLPEMTWGNGAALYGGQSATADDTDTGDDAGPGDTYVSVTVSGGDVTDVNLGFAYNLIVNTADDGLADNARSDQGSLRQFLKNANAIGALGGTTANSSEFRIPGAGPDTITPLSAFPTITEPTVIDGTTDPDFATTPIIELDGTSAGVDVNGLYLEPGSGGSTIRGLVINRFSDEGIRILAGSDGNTIAGNFIGTDVSGTVDQGNARIGIHVRSASNVIGGTSQDDRNLISGNGGRGISISQATAIGNQVLGNYIGTDVSGSSAIPNGELGITIDVSASNNVVGGTTTDRRNVVAGNTSGEIRIAGSGTTDNRIEGNYIGVDASGITVLATSHAIVTDNGATGNVIGGTMSGAGNLIRSNRRGIHLVSSTDDDNAILGNSIYGCGWRGIDTGDPGVSYNDAEDGDTGSNDGLNFPVLKNIVQNGANLEVSADIDAPSGSYRVELFENPGGNDPTGFGEGESFLTWFPLSVSGNPGYENFFLTLPGVVATDIIGMTATLTEDFGGGNYGSTSEFGPAFGGAGVLVVDTTDDVSDGDTSSISSLIGNRGADQRISLREAIVATNNTPNIDGDPDSLRFDIPEALVAGAHTIVAASGGLPDITDGIVIDGATEPDFAGAPVIEIVGSLAGAGANGLDLDAGSGGSTIRGLVINRFDQHGILLSSSSNVVAGNYIGIDVTGSVDLGNGQFGVGILNAAGNLIGGSTVADRNVISGNDDVGVRFSGAAADDNLVQGNYIGTNAAGTGGLANTNFGVMIDNGADWNFIGTNSDGSADSNEGNVIVGGVNIAIQLAEDNVVAGNLIGTDAAGTVALGGAGIYFSSDANNNRIGTDADGTADVDERNIISGISGSAVHINTGSGNAVAGNYIGTDVTGTVALGNTGNGVRIRGGATNTAIGGTAPVESNLIANNALAGVTLLSDAGTANSMLGNSIHDNGGLGIDLADDGVTANDAGDSDTGANNLQNFPVITSATEAGGTITVDYDLDLGAPLTGDYRIEFFKNPSGVDATHGEGEAFASAITISHGGTGLESFSHSFAGAAGDVLTATTTDSLLAGGYGSTSEFSAWSPVTALPAYTVSGRVFEDADFTGTASAYDGGTNDAGQPNVDVELYDGSDVYVSSVTTGAGGTFSFIGLSDGTYKIRARSATIGDADSPPAGGLNATVPATWPYPLSEMTWGNGAAAYGGQNATTDDTDTGDDAGPGDTYVSVTVSGGDETDVNLGFTFNLIVNTADDGLADNTRSDQGSLRQFLKNANAIGTAGGTTANSSEFRIPNTDPGYNGTGNGEYTIEPTNELPEITDSITIDGYTQPGSAANTAAAPAALNGTPLIVVDGSSAGGGIDGLSVAAANTTIRGLVMHSFTGSAVELTAASVSATIAGNYLGTEVTGASAAANGFWGVEINSGSNFVGGSNPADRNLISGNTDAGVMLWFATAAANRIEGNLIGTNAAGMAGVPNGFDGIDAGGGARTTTIVDNVVSGNGEDGIEIVDASDGNVLQGNYVGLNAAGTGAVPNGRHGIVLYNGPNSTQIGGIGKGNVISGNANDGIVIDGNLGATTANNVIEGNYIGTNADGDAPVPNLGSGIRIFNGPDNNTIGGTGAGEGNVISGNGSKGVEINGSATSGNFILGNLIGTNAAGTGGVPNGAGGVDLSGDTSANTIGGTAAGSRNVISGNTGHGIEISWGIDNIIEANYIGPDVNGTGDLGNTQDGVQITGSSTGNRVGGSTSVQRNIISGNDGNGITITGALATGNLIQGNYIGTQADGSGVLGNTQEGVEIVGAATGNTIGGRAAGTGNRIAHNGSDGVDLKADAGSGNSIIGNEILLNIGLGIDLGTNGVTGNDGGDVDTGPNDLLNFPEITSATESGGTITVDFDLDLPGGFYRIEFFKNPGGADPTGYGEGEFFVDSLVINHVGSGVESFSHSLSGSVGETLTATCTECLDGSSCTGLGSTSEFSAAVGVTEPPALTIVKRAFLADGSAVPTGLTLARGTTVHYLLYINNDGSARADMSTQDILDASFAYQLQSMRVDNSLSDCATGNCTAAEEQAIFEAVVGQSTSTDEVDGDVVSYTAVSRTIDAGNSVVGNAQLDVAGSSVLALLFTIEVQ